MSVEKIVDIDLLQDKNSITSSLSFKLVNGALAGVIGTSIIFPIDMVKTQLQNQKVGSDGKLPFNGIGDCFQKLVKKDGIKGLYRGLVPNLIGVTPEKAIKLAVNDLAREKFAKNLGVSQDNLPVEYGMLAGATAGFCQVIATNPMEIVKIRLQVADVSSVKPSAVEVVRDLGVKGLYKGTGATLLRDIPFSVMFFPSHAFLKQKLADADGHTSSGNIFLSGIIAGGVAAAAVTPSDVVKTRLQVASKVGSQQFSSYLGCLKHIIQNEGASTLFRGALPRAMIVAPLFGIALLTYELLQKVVDDLV